MIKLALLLLILLARPAEARIDGVEYTTLNVQGVEHECIIGNPTRKSEILIIKKALAGDKDAREILLAGNKDYWYFIGSEKPIWLKITEDSEEIIHSVR